MAAFSFPSNPTVGQTYTGPNNIVYTWDGVKWKANTQFTVVTTPPQFDNDTSIATTEFVQRALGNYKGAVVSSVTSGITLLASDAGIVLGLNAGAGQTVTLPPGGATLDGSSFTVTRYLSALATVQTSASQSIDTGYSLATSVTLRGGDTATFTWSVPQGAWVMSGPAVMRIAGMGANLAPNGYQRLPSGLILQWGNVMVTGQGPLTVSLPMAFPTEFASITGIETGSTPTIGYSVIRNSLSAFTVYSSYTVGLNNVQWQAIGY